jgi:hypothetical protein
VSIYLRGPLGNRPREWRAGHPPEAGYDTEPRRVATTSMAYLLHSGSVGGYFELTEARVPARRPSVDLRRGFFTAAVLLIDLLARP